MELSNFISMVQYEILKSFDFASIMQDDLQNDLDTKIQLAIEAAEIEIPLIFEMERKSVNPSDIKSKYPAKTSLEVPFNTNLEKIKIGSKNVILNPISKELDKPQKTAKLVKLEENTPDESSIEGDIILVKIANTNSKKDSNFDASLVGKIKLTIKPILK